MRYFHDAEGKTVYAMTWPPSSSGLRNRRTRRYEGCDVSAEIVITRADNALSVDGRWKYPCGSYLSDRFAVYDSEKRAVSMFEMTHVPKFPEIDEATYQRLKSEYEREIEKNSSEAC